MNLSTLLENAAAKYPEKTALICNGRWNTYESLKIRANCIANSLYFAGITKGTKVAILAYNSIEFIEIIFALMKIGAVGVPLNHRLTDSELELLIEHAEAKALFYEPGLHRLIPNDVEGLEHIISMGGKTNIASFCYEDLLTCPREQPVYEQVGEDDTSFIIYTAGTTGNPKGVLLTHNNLLWNTVNYAAAYQLTPEDIELATTPLFHISTLGRAFTYISSGITFILCRKFDPKVSFELIQSHGVTSITQTPTMYHMMLRVFNDQNWDTSSVKRVVSGASPMSLKTKEALKVLFPRAGFYDLYGLTEASPGVSILTPPDFERKMGSVGKPMQNVEVRIKGKDKRPAPAGLVGEIVCRGPNIMRGYYKDPDATKHALQNGWLHTGDLGKLDEEGYLYIKGRKKDLIISGGINIYPGEVEEILMQHPAVEDAAVIGVRDETWGEKVLAFVVLNKDNICTEQHLLAFCKERLAGFKCPKSVIYSNHIPRNAAQKVLKEELRKMHSSR
jgi:acyl-CoA synthetase (AMP-forming)/AMP-acid ligase II